MSKPKRLIVGLLAVLTLAISAPTAWADAPGPGDKQCRGATGTTTHTARQAKRCLVGAAPSSAALTPTTATQCESCPRRVRLVTRTVFRQNFSETEVWVDPLVGQGL